MTGRERLTRLFAGDTIDRVPIWLLAPFHRLHCYADIYHIPAYAPVIAHIEKYCDTFDRRSYNTGFCFNGNPDIVRGGGHFTENGQTVEESTVQYKDFRLSKRIARGAGRASVQYMVRDIDTLDEILAIPYQPSTPDVSAYAQEKAALGDRGLMMTDVGDPLLPLYYLMSAEDFSIYSLTDYEKILTFADEMYRRVLDIYRYLLEREIGEVFFIVGSEFAGPPMVSPEKFNDMSARYIKGLCDLIRSYGKKSIVHYHGNLLRVLTGMRSVGFDGLHTVEAPPVGDCTLTQAREALGKDTVLIGNIQYNDLDSLMPDAIDAMVKSAIAEGRSGRFILSPTAGPYDPNPSPRLIANYIAFVEAGIRYGAY